VTATAYNLESRWDIPAYVWPGVLGLSVLLHLAILTYGLPVLPWSADSPEELPETEVVIDAGGPVFEQVPELAPQPLELAEAQRTEVVQQTRPEVLPVQPAETNNLQAIPSEPLDIEPTQIEPVQVEQGPVAPLASVEAPLLPQTAPEAVEVIEAEEVAAVQPEMLPQESVAALETVPVETIEVSQVETMNSPEAVPSIQTPAEVLQPETDTGVPTVEAVPAIPVVIPQNDTQPPLIAAETEEVTVTEAAEVDVISALTQESAPVIEVSPSSVPLQSGQQVVDLNVGMQAVTDVSSLAPETQQVLTDTPQSGASIISAEETAGVVTPNETITLTPVEASGIDTIAPETQQLTDVARVETEVAALTPTDPETAAVPSIKDSSAPADIVPPVEVAAIDPLANITSYVRNYDFGECAHLSVLSAGADSAEVTAFGTGIGAFAVFDQRFRADQGFEASIQLRLVTAKQCALLNALGVSQGIEAAGLVELDKTVVKSGTLTTGLIQRDLPMARIAAAEQAGLDLGGKGPPELYLIDDAGQIHDGRDFLLPASNATTAGAWRFKVPVVLKSAKDQETALVLAIWNRPASRQPPRFGTLPPSRVDTVLSEPGVYSLAAFKVSR